MRRLTRMFLLALLPVAVFLLPSAASATTTPTGQQATFRFTTLHSAPVQLWHSGSYTGYRQTGTVTYSGALAGSARETVYSVVDAATHTVWFSGADNCAACTFTTSTGAKRTGAVTVFFKGVDQAGAFRGGFLAIGRSGALTTLRGVGGFHGTDAAGYGTATGLFHF